MCQRPRMAHSQSWHGPVPRPTVADTVQSTQQPFLPSPPRAPVPFPFAAPTPQWARDPVLVPGGKRGVCWAAVGRGIPSGTQAKAQGGERLFSPFSFPLFWEASKGT